MLPGGCVAQDDGIEGAVLTVHGNHAVGDGGVVVNGIAGMQDLGVGADADLHVAPDDDVALLALMGHQLDILVLGFGPVLHLHVKRQCDPVAEVSSQVVADHVVGFLNPLAFALSGQVVGAELGAFAFQQIRHIHPEDQGAAVKEGNA